ncbi:class I SAM-dependent methyltransferase [Streptomyces sp. Z26]|uniref:class I SAM-dependent methyltransferase n=1 Tax=Streptomyces sp. Z26 TaxID=2500177 RepID=UPI000EF136BF|nr:class I SAM-dependent methyltransferase [Streptomyces sp. Z26]RLL67287.1 class I SAM-dependent methyltransferase [Streptomyces sp. Z26]
MPMNRAHRRLCGSEKWADSVRERLLPWALDGVELGTDVLEIGPGYGANLRVLVERAPRVTALEVDAGTARQLERVHGDRARVVHGDGADMPLPDGCFSAVVCFTMLHHVPTAAQQDRIFAEAHRVLRTGSVFAGSDSTGGSLRFRLLHLRDTMNTVDPDALPGRLRAAGFEDVEVAVHPEVGTVRFRAVRS